MNRRSFLWNTGIVGVGLLGGRKCCTWSFARRHREQFGFKSYSGGKTRGIYRTTAAVLV